MRDGFSLYVGSLCVWPRSLPTVTKLIPLAQSCDIFSWALIFV